MFLDRNGLELYGLARRLWYTLRLVYFDLGNTFAARSIYIKIEQCTVISLIYLAFIIWVHLLCPNFAFILDINNTNISLVSKMQYRRVLKLSPIIRSPLFGQKAAHSISGHSLSESSKSIVLTHCWSSRKHTRCPVQVKNNAHNAFSPWINRNPLIEPFTWRNVGECSSSVACNWRFDRLWICPVASMTERSGPAKIPTISE